MLDRSDPAVSEFLDQCGVSALSNDEQQQLQQHEQVIQRGLQTFLDVGAALVAIRDSRLYRADYSTFEAYCEEKWGIGRAHAYRLINASTIAANLSPIGDEGDLAGATESQLRELSGLRPEQQRHVWSVLQQSGEKLTAAKVRAAVVALRESQPQPQPQPQPQRGVTTFHWEHTDMDAALIDVAARCNWEWKFAEQCDGQWLHWFKHATGDEDRKSLMSWAGTFQGIGGYSLSAADPVPPVAADPVPPVADSLPLPWLPSDLRAYGFHWDQQGAGGPWRLISDFLSSSPGVKFATDWVTPEQAIEQARSFVSASQLCQPAATEPAHVTQQRVATEREQAARRAFYAALSSMTEQQRALFALAFGYTGPSFDTFVWDRVWKGQFKDDLCRLLEVI